MSSVPRVDLWQVTYVAERDGFLPPLPTTAFHGGLGHALYHGVCVAKARPSCRGCPVERLCAYPRLFDPPVCELPLVRELGVTTEAPRPWALAPEAPFVPTGERPHPVRVDQVVRFRLAVTPAAADLWQPLLRALRRAGHFGFGERRQRVALKLLGVEPIGSEDPLPSTRVRLRLLTPLRIKHEGQIASSLTPRLLVEAIVRRAALLGSLGNDGCSWPEDWREKADSLRMRANLRITRASRFSSTQRRLLRWPGLMGWIDLEGEALPELWPLLCFGSKAQIGKATTFGFGRYEVDPHPAVEENGLEPGVGNGHG